MRSEHQVWHLAWSGAPQEAAWMLGLCILHSELNPALQLGANSVAWTVSLLSVSHPVLICKAELGPGPAVDRDEVKLVNM